MINGLFMCVIAMILAIAFLPEIIHYIWPTF